MKKLLTASIMSIVFIAFPAVTHAQQAQRTGTWTFFVNASNYGTQLFPYRLLPKYNYTFMASGAVCDSGDVSTGDCEDDSVGPNGPTSGYTCGDDIEGGTCPVAGLPFGALLAYYPSFHPFVLGSSTILSVPATGYLYLAVNISSTYYGGYDEDDDGDADFPFGGFYLTVTHPCLNLPSYPAYYHC